MNVSGYLIARLGEVPPEDTELAGHHALDEIDLLTMAQIIDENQPVSAPSVKDEEISQWITIGDVLAREEKYQGVSV